MVHPKHTTDSPPPFPLTRESIAARLKRPAPRPLPEDRHLVTLPPGARVTEAAVLVPLVGREDGIRILFTQRDYTAGELVEVANFVNQNYSGQSFEEVRSRLHGELSEIRQDMIQLMTAAVDAGSEALAQPAEPYVISGERNLLGARDLTQDMSRLKQLLELFERKTSLVQILDVSLRGEGVQIFIGGESGFGAPDDVSVVTSPYKVDGEVVGTVGVIGPTRMAYDRVIPIVDVTAKLLSSALSQH